MSVCWIISLFTWWSKNSYPVLFLVCNFYYGIYTKQADKFCCVCFVLTLSSGDVNCNVWCKKNFCYSAAQNKRQVFLHKLSSLCHAHGSVLVVCRWMKAWVVACSSLTFFLVRRLSYFSSFALWRKRKISTCATKSTWRRGCRQCFRTAWNTTRSMYRHRDIFWWLVVA